MLIKTHWIRFLVLLACLSLSCALFSPLAGEPTPSVDAAQATQAAAPTLAPTSMPSDTALPSPTPSSLPPTGTEPPAQEATQTPGAKGPCPGLLPTRLEAGIYAYVIPQPPLPSRVRIGPGTNFPAKGLAQPGAVMKITDGPLCGSGQIWWKIDLRFSDLAGWVAEGNNQDYWLAPCPEEGHCPPLD